MKQLLLLLLTILSARSGAQTFMLKYKVAYADSKQTKPISFSINGHRFGEKDTSISIKTTVKTFDKCMAIIGNDTLSFIAKFKAGEVYNLSQGCCCAAFILAPEKLARRGTITYRNNTDKTLALVVAEANNDTVMPRKEKTVFAHESAMCMFKPCSILITDREYLAEKYSYRNNNESFDSLAKEQTSLIQAKTWFHFLHGEKTELVYDESKHALKIELKGYLSDEEFKQAFEQP